MLAGWRGADRVPSAIKGSDLMRITEVHLRNFRRLEGVKIDLEAEDTVFVGPNNSGKTSATAAFRLFLGSPEFKIHDFSVSKISAFDAFGSADAADEESLPSIEMDLWFSIDPSVEYGRVGSLLPNIADNLEEAGIRLRYCVRDAETLKSSYLSAFPTVAEGSTQKSLSHYLSLQGNLSRHFALCYYSLERTADRVVHHPLEPEEGKRVLGLLIRVDFVDAQRNIDDHEVGRSNRLSTAFAAFYKKNLEQADISEDANRVIDENNENLNQHYDEHFKELMAVIQDLGVPSINDRQMRITSSLTAEAALRGGTSLLYVDPALKHELPEAYNGLGFKNLIYMAIQISHYHLQWRKTEHNRPLCQLIFIEEPESHLHAQVQQTFISNIWKIVQKASEDAGEINMVPQLGITTHSSHILDAVEFRKVRYFRRCVLAHEDPTNITTLHASTVLSLREFKPCKSSAAGEIEDEQQTLNFLDQYLKLTHCDLFFADATVLVEGTVEKLLLPKMIDKTAPGLKQRYLTILEVGGAYAHRFASLLEFLGIPYLIITDLDSVDPANNRKACRADTAGAVTSNASLGFFINQSNISELAKLDPGEHVLGDERCYVAFQKPTSVEGYDPGKKMHGRTFEETFVYQNMQLFRDKTLTLGTPLPDDQDFETEFSTVFERVGCSTFKKTAFALDVASSIANWQTPQYIVEGLRWLETKTCATAHNGTV